jgi:hypothetical protein
MRIRPPKKNDPSKKDHMYHLVEIFDVREKPVARYG